MHRSGQGSAGAAPDAVVFAGSPEGSAGIWELSCGRLEVRADSGAEVGSDGLFRVAERINPRRPFLFVSTVLGRHIPVRASRHREILTRLAAKIPELGPGPVLVLGFAETAVGLGAGIHDALIRRTGRKDLAGLASTRHGGVGETWIGFREEHSHAPDHLLLRPAAGVAALAESARVLVLVDDEASTGRTFAGVTKALVGARGRGFDAIHLVTLTDWSGGAAVTATAAAAGMDPARVTMTALLSGSYHWQGDGRPGPASLPPGCPPLPVGELGADPGNWRLGHPVRLPSLDPDWRQGRTLLIGTGEYVWPAFRLAEEIESIGGTAHFLATTRSPVAPGPVIESRAVFADHYGLGIEMYLHNVHPADWDRILLLTEGGPERICPRLAAHLGGFTLLTPDGNRHPMSVTGAQS